MVARRFPVKIVMDADAGGLNRIQHTHQSFRGGDMLPDREDIAEHQVAGLKIFDYRLKGGS